MTVYKENLRHAFILNCKELLKDLESKHTEFSRINIKDYNLNPRIFRAMKNLGFLEINSSTKQRLYKFNPSIRDEKYNQYTDSDLSQLIFNKVQSDINVKKLNHTMLTKNVQNVSTNNKLISINTNKPNKEAEQTIEIIFDCLKSLIAEFKNNKTLTKDEIAFHIDLVCESKSFKLLGEEISDILIKTILNTIKTKSLNFVSGMIKYPDHYELYTDKYLYDETFLKTESIKIYNCIKEQTDSTYNRIFNLLKYLSTLKEFTKINKTELFKKYKLSQHYQVITKYVMISIFNDEYDSNKYKSKYKWNLKADVCIANVAHDLELEIKRYTTSSVMNSYYRNKNKAGKKNIADLRLERILSFVTFLSNIKTFQFLKTENLFTSFKLNAQRDKKIIFDACMISNVNSSQYKWNLGDDENLKELSNKIYKKMTEKRIEKKEFEKREFKPLDFSKLQIEQPIKQFKIKKIKIKKIKIKKIKKQRQQRRQQHFIKNFDNVKNFVRALYEFKDFTQIKSIYALAKMHNVNNSNTISPIIEACLEKRNWKEYRWKIEQTLDDSVFEFISNRILEYGRKYYPNSAQKQNTTNTTEINNEIIINMKQDNNVIEISTDILNQKLHEKLKNKEEEIKNKEEEIKKLNAEAANLRNLIKEGEKYAQVAIEAKNWFDQVKNKI